MISVIDVYYFGLYFLLCALSVYSGMGVLLLFNLDADTKKLLFLSPLITQALIALLLNISVQLSVPVRSSYLFIWSVFIAFGIYGFIRHRKHETVRYKWLIACWLILPLMIMAGSYWYGSATKFGDVLPDGWAYITVGQYLWKYPLGTEGGLSPLYQYASTLASTRFTSSAFLALFSPWFQQHDTAAGSGIFLGWIIFVLAGACGFFIAEKQLSDRKKSLYVILVIFSGWVWNVLWAANYDNLLALAYAPMLIEIFLNGKYFTKQWATLLGLIIAALALIYLELAGLIFAILFIILIIHFVQADATNRKKILVFVFVLGSVSLSILLPFSKWLVTFFLTQLDAISAQVVKPGLGLFSGLLQFQCVPSSFWAMGCEQIFQGSWLYVGGDTITKSWLLAKNILASILSLFVITGLVWLVLRRKWGEIIPLFIIALAAGYMVIVQHYSYGAYKFVLLLWWMIPYLLLLGIQYFEEFKSPRSGFVSALLYVPLLLLLLLTAFRVSYTASTKSAWLRSEYAQVRNALTLTQESTILVSVDDWLSSAWANYYLRDQDTFLYLKRRYMARDPAAINRSMKINLDSIQYVLTDAYSEKFFLQESVWTGKPYSLWKLPNDWVWPGDIQNTNGVENWAGKTRLWLGKEEAVLSFLSSFDGTAVIIGRFGPGPSLSPGQPATIEVWNDLGFLKRIKVASEKYILFNTPVKKGENQLFVRSLDDSATIPLANGDPRILLASVSGIHYFNGSTDWLFLADVINTNSAEHINGFSSFWISNEAIKIIFFASRAGQVGITGDFSPGPSFPDSTRWKLSVRTDSGYMDEIIITEHSGIQIPARQGLNEITIQVLDKPTLSGLPNGDQRILLMRLSNLNLVYQADKP
jgi:hypothetical protein